MNPTDIYKLLWNDKRSSDYVMAIGPDAAMRYISPDEGGDSCYIIRVDSPKICKDSPGGFARDDSGVGHWVLLVMTHDCVEFFDSLGFVELCTYGEEMRRFSEKYKCLRVNDVTLDTVNCAEYCLVYSYYRSRGESSEVVVKRLKNLRCSIKRECRRLYGNNTSDA